MQQAAVRIVTGKGGVGKSCVAAALALAAAKRGERVLLCEVDGGDRQAELLGVEKLGYRLREVMDNLFLVDAQPQPALREYVLLVLRFEALYKAFFDNPLVRSFVRAVPSLGELVMIGKIWYHTAPRPLAKERFDLIVVDAPASGHALALLGAPAAVASAVPPGPMRDNALLLRDMLQRHEQTLVVPVCLAEDMAVTEALQLVAGVQALGVAVAAPLCNALPARIEAADVHACATAAGAAAAAATDALKRRLARQQEADAQLARLADFAGAPARCLPRLRTRPLDAASLAALATMLADYVPTALPSAAVGP